MIVRPFDGERIAVAQRALGFSGPVWLCCPGTCGPFVARDFIAWDPVEVIRGEDLGALQDAWNRARTRWQGAPPQVPVGIGFVSYDLGLQFDRIRGSRRMPSDFPMLEFRFFDRLLTWDEQGKAEIWAADAHAADRPVPEENESLDLQARGTELRDVEPRLMHESAITEVLAYIHAGDVYQVNLARRLRAELPAADPLGLGLFSRLRFRAPSAHGFFFADPQAGWSIVGNSPERFLSVNPSGTVRTCPIKGTRRRHADPEEDRQVLAHLRASEKDRAEHAMIVDLERNDLGRVCGVGSVAVESLMESLTLPHVHHLVSTVRGQLRSDLNWPAAGLEPLLRATFPGGSITGAPKLRAMEIIAALEKTSRGVYCGATGWLGAAGDLDLAVAIRTGQVQDRQLTVWVGGGIVADSNPAHEWAETEAKAAAFAAMFRAG